MRLKDIWNAITWPLRREVLHTGLYQAQAWSPLHGHFHFVEADGGLYRREQVRVPVLHQCWAEAVQKRDGSYRVVMHRQIAPPSSAYYYTDDEEKTTVLGSTRAETVDYLHRVTKRWRTEEGLQPTESKRWEPASADLRP